MYRRLLLVVAALAAMLGLVPLSPADAAPQFADAQSATVHPGVQTVTEGAGQCTSNFVFTQGDEVYLGQAAHCAGLGEATDTNGCEAGSLPIGTTVEIQGASNPGTLAYSSWLSMQAKGETDPDVCAYNDFALVKVHPADRAKVNPSVPNIGGPVSLAGATSFGESVYTYGNSSLRLGISQLSPKTGISLGTTGNGWSHTVYTVTPGIPGDSGSGVLDSQGRAIGTLSTVAIAPLALSNGVGDLASELAYANANSALNVKLAKGTETFAGTSGVLAGILGG